MIDAKSKEQAAETMTKATAVAVAALNTAMMKGPARAGGLLPPQGQRYRWSQWRYRSWRSTAGGCRHKVSNRG